MRMACAASAACLAALLAGCFGGGSRIVSIAEVDGSNDHRIFRIGSIGKIMMEPVLWRLEDSGAIDFDRPVGEYLRDALPPEFDDVTLRMLHDNVAGLPRELMDLLCLEDIVGALSSGIFGTDLYFGFATRREFIARLWRPSVRVKVARRDGDGVYSNAGYVLMMMAIEDATGMTAEELCRRHLIEPYGLVDTSFEPGEAMLQRVLPPCAGSLPWVFPAGTEIPDHRENEIVMHSGGMLSSASDILKVCYVIMPHVERASGLLFRRRLPCGRDVFFRHGMVYGGSAFVGFDPAAPRAVVLLRNATCWPSDDGIDLMEHLANPPR